MLIPYAVDRVLDEAMKALELIMVPRPPDWREASIGNWAEDEEPEVKFCPIMEDCKRPKKNQLSLTLSKRHYGPKKPHKGMGTGTWVVLCWTLSSCTLRGGMGIAVHAYRRAKLVL